MSSLFSSGETIAKSSTDIVRLFFLMADERVSLSYFAFVSSREGTSDYLSSLRIFQASLSALLVRCKTRMDSKKGKKDYRFKFADIKEKIDSAKVEHNFEAMFLLNEYLESDLKLTDIASQQSYDKKNIIVANKIQGFK